MKKLLLLLVFGVFGLFSTYVLYVHGYMGLWQSGFTNLATLQILCDLVIACLLLCTWMLADAPKHGLSAMPYVLITLAAGSFGPLLYLIRREMRQAAPALGAPAR